MAAAGEKRSSANAIAAHGETTGEGLNTQVEEVSARSSNEFLLMARTKQRDPSMSTPLKNGRLTRRIDPVLPTMHGLGYLYPAGTLVAALG